MWYDLSRKASEALAPRRGLPMTWNYRVVKTVCAVLSVRDGMERTGDAFGGIRRVPPLPRHEDGYTRYGIHEVFYAEGQRSAGTADDDGVPCVPMLGKIYPRTAKSRY